MMLQDLPPRTGSRQLAQTSYVADCADGIVICK